LIDENDNIVPTRQLRANDWTMCDQSASEELKFGTFTREHARKTLSNNPTMCAWLEAQEKLQEKEFEVCMIIWAQHC